MTPRAGWNIWLISKYASLPKYGPGSRLFYLARELRRDGHEPLLVTSDANHLAQFPETSERYNQEEVDGVRVCWIKTRKYTRTASVGRILSWVDFERRLLGLPRRQFPRPDVVIVSSLSLLSVLYGYYLKRRIGVPLVFEIRDIWPLTLVVEGGFPRWHPLVVCLGLIERFGYRNADLIVGTMPRLDLHVRDAIGRERPFHCSPLGFAPESTEEETPLSDEFLRRHFPEDKVIIGYAGSMGTTNALKPLMRCIEEMSDRTDVHFVLLGMGDQRETFAARMAGRANVSFVPRIAKTEVASFLRCCDILYLSAHDSPVWRFGQSLNKMVDYMLAGKPIIASYSGYPSMLNEAEAGVFVQAGDHRALRETITQMVAMPAERRAEIGARGRAWLLANRSYAVLAKQYLSALERIVQRES